MRLSGLRGYRLRAAAALVVAGLAALALYGYLKELEERTAKNGPLLRVAVAAVNIPAGRRLESDCMDWQAMPERYVMGCMLRTGAENRVALHDIAKGDLLLESDLASAGNAGSIALRLPPGTRGYPLPLERTSLPAVALQPGDRLDVLAVHDEKSDTILEGVALLDLVGLEPATSSGGGLPGLSGSGSSGFVILQLTPDEAERLARAANRESGSIILIICPLENAGE